MEYGQRQETETKLLILVPIHSKNCARDVVQLFILLVPLDLLDYSFSRITQSMLLKIIESRFIRSSKLKKTNLR